MKKLMFLTVIAVFACCLSSIVYATSPEISGFRGLKWGSSLEDAQKAKVLHVLESDPESKSTLCSIDNDVMRIGSARLTSITYLFWDGKLTSVEIHTTGERDFHALKAAVFEKFGKGTNDGSPERESFYWKGEVSNISLNYIEASERGTLHLGAKKQEELWQVFQAEQARRGAATDF